MLKPAKHVQTALRLLLVVCAAVLAVPLRWHPGASGLDGSWAWALNVYATLGLVHGRDVLFSYGPWGYLAFPHPGPTWLAGMLAQTALWVAFIAALLVVALVRRCSLLGLVLFTLLLWGGLGCFHDFGFAGPDLFFAFLALLFLGLALEGRFWWVWLLLGVSCGAALLLVKLSSGILVLSAVAVYPLAFFFLDRSRARASALLVLAAPLLFVLFFFTHAASPVALSRYVRFGLDIASGYSAAMSEGDNSLHLLPALWIALAYLGVVAVLWWQRQKAAVLATACLGPLFLVFKHSFVRSSGHSEIYFLFSALLVGVVCLFVEWRRSGWWQSAAALALFAVVWLPRELPQYRRDPFVHVRALADLVHPPAPVFIPSHAAA